MYRIKAERLVTSSIDNDEVEEHFTEKLRAHASHGRILVSAAAPWVTPNADGTTTVTMLFTFMDSSDVAMPSQMQEVLLELQELLLDAVKKLDRLDQQIQLLANKPLSVQPAARCTGEECGLEVEEHLIEAHLALIRQQKSFLDLIIENFVSQEKDSEWS